MRDRNFILNSIKMDLHRVVTAVGKIDHEIPKQSVIEFLNHATKDLNGLQLTPNEQLLKSQLQTLINKIPETHDLYSRLRWAEDVMTIRCRLIVPAGPTEQD